MVILINHYMKQHLNDYSVLAIVCNRIQWLNFDRWWLLLYSTFRDIADIHFCQRGFVSYPYYYFYCLNFINAVQCLVKLSNGVTDTC